MSQLSNLTQKELNRLITVDSSNSINFLLETYGVCIIEQVFDDEKCDFVFNKMIEDFEYRTSNLPLPFEAGNVETWKTLENFEPLHNMLYKNWGIGQAQYIWDHVRTDQNIINCFSEIWGTDQLICSMDAVSLHLPGELTGQNYFHKNDWYHFDQSFLKPDIRCYQGLINMFDTNENDSTLCVFLNSHKVFSQFAEQTIGSDKNTLSEKDLKKKYGDNFNKTKYKDFFVSNGCVELRIQCPKGSFVIWDSRILHMGSQPLKERKRANIRSIFYVCMVPIDRISEYAFSKKIFIKRSLENLKELRTTTHWPQYRKFETFIPSSRFKGKSVDPGFLYPDPPELNERALQLVTGVYSESEANLLP